MAVREKVFSRFLRSILWGIPDAPFVSVLLLSVGYSAQETTAPHQPPGTGAHLERYRENSCRTRFCSRPQVPLFAGHRGLPQEFVPADGNPRRAAAEVVKQMRRKDAPPELADRRAVLTCKIAELRKEDKIAEGAIKRIQRTRESNRIDRENRMPLHPRPRRRRREQERE